MPASDTRSVRSGATTTPGAAGGSMIKRKVDDRIKMLVDDVAHKKHRGLILLVGDRGKDQIANFHLMISRANHNAKVNVLWCMKEDPDFGSTSRKKQERRARLEVKGGLATEATKEAFQTFLAQTPIRFCKYQETHRILGQTFGMAVLQDFEAITPNTLARTIETVKGGGLIVIMFRAMRSLRQLYTIAMDVHARYRTESQRAVVPRFNERFLLSLADCDTALCVDDDLNVLPITRKMRDYGKDRKHRRESDGNDHYDEDNDDRYDADLAVQGRLKHEVDLLNLKEKLRPSAAVGPLVQLCQTMDQAKTVLTLMQAVTDKSLDSTCVVTAGRGRGKSAALGMAAAGAVAQGYSSILCTAPTPENLHTFFEFAVKGLKDLGYVERTEFEALQSTSEEFSKCIIRINIFREHRQTVQFVSATDTEKFAQAEIAIIDEAAALPLPLVKKIIGPYLVFLASTVSGYEGTGRSLSMKLVADMRKRSGKSTSGAAQDTRFLREIAMHDPIRYGPSDPVERWMHKLLCLDATEAIAPLRTSPHPNACELYYVNRDALFSYHPLAEELLQRAQSLLVAAHYKNQPNDLQLLSDAPGHHIFVLCASSIEGGHSTAAEDPTEAAAMPGKNGVKSTAASASAPDIFCIIHACEEGQVSAEALKSNMSHGLRPSGDLIPYTLSQYYLEEGFAKLAGLRIVRIATSPELQHAGYGSRALQLLYQYFSGAISLTPAARGATASTAAAEVERDHARVANDGVDSALLAPRPRVTGNLLTPLHERPYEPLDYLGVSFGVTTELFSFWHRAGYEPLYIRQAANELTGEHSCVMVRPMGFTVDAIKREFRSRFLRLFSMPFRALPTELALSVLSADMDVHDAKKLAERTDTSRAASERLVLVGGYPQARWADIAARLSAADLKRLRLFSSTFIESGNVLDLVPELARAYFNHSLYRLPDGTEGVVLSHAQAAVLVAVGLQCQTLEQLAGQRAFAGVPVQQLRAFFQKALSRIIDHLVKLRELDGESLVATGSGSASSGGKRARVSNGNDATSADEDVREITDPSGNVVGLSVSKKVRTTVSTDTSLMRDARSAVLGDNEKEVHKDLQDLFYRPKKGGSSRHR